MAAVADNAIDSENQFIHRMPASSDSESEYQRDVRKLVDLLSKLNPSAKEFFPSWRKSDGRLSADAPVFVSSVDYYNSSNGFNYGNSGKDSSSDGSSNNQPMNRRTRNGYNQGRRRMNDRMRRAEREESIRRTVYVSDIDQNVTEEHLAELFAPCGQVMLQIYIYQQIFSNLLGVGYIDNVPFKFFFDVVDCRICGDPHSILRFAFIEFADEEGAMVALNIGGTLLGYYPVKVLPSKTAILPVNPKFLPKSNDEREMVVRTVYCTNIDKKVTQSEVKQFFEQVCGEVSRLRLLGDNAHSTRIAFVEFVQAESAILALNCSGMFLGSLQIRISPSKTPVKPRIPRAASH